MNLSFEPGDPFESAADTVIIPVAASRDEFMWPTFTLKIPAEFREEVSRFADDAHFAGKLTKTLIVPTLGHLAPRRIVLMGIGEAADVSASTLTQAAGAALRAASDSGAHDVSFGLPDSTWYSDSAGAVEALAVGATLGMYRFDAYRGAASSDRRQSGAPESVRFAATDIAPDSAQLALRRAAAIAQGVTIARDLSNEPASVLTPDALAERATALATNSGLEIEILGPDQLAAIGAEATLAVGGGSSHPPRLVRLRYRPDREPASPKITGLVGKAITFDTGGYSIKPYEGMLAMKGDMAGGAAVLGAMSALRILECPIVVEATICAAENMISGTAFRPGDVLRGMNGVTMEILSTDAEGRLVLADGLVDTARRGATELIDLATLTGATVVALGDGTMALFASDDPLAERLLTSAAATGERMWRMPLIEELERKIEGDVADIRNSGGRAGGAITAALFLRHFREGLPWAHLDIAGSTRQDKATPLGPQGATGVGVRTLLHYLTANGDAR